MTDLVLFSFFFSSYIEALTCISNLLEVCPEERHRDIKVALVNFNGMEQELSDLCMTNNLYESKYIWVGFQTCAKRGDPKLAHTYMYCQVPSMTNRGDSDKTAPMYRLVRICINRICPKLRFCWFYSVGASLYQTSIVLYYRIYSK